MSSYVRRLIRNRKNDDVDRGWEVREDLFEIERRRKMEKTFSSIMSEFMKGISEDDKKKMMACEEKMASICPCTKMKEMSAEEKKAMMEKMMSSFFKKMCPQPEGGGKARKA